MGKAGQNKATPEPTKLEKRVDTVPYITGFCGIGAHEGSRVLSLGGNLLRSCSGEYDIQFGKAMCNCDCHTVARQVREAVARMSAIEEDNSDIVIEIPKPRPPSGLIGLDDDLDLDLVHMIRGFADTEDSAPRVDVPEPKKEPAPGHLDMQDAPSSAGEPDLFLASFVDDRPLVPKPRQPSEPTFKATQSGHAAKGQLEYRVKVAVLNWWHVFHVTTGTTVGYLTPKYVSEQIDKDNPPSNGAVYAVFKRWEAAGLVELASSPFRLVKVTGLR